MNRLKTILSGAAIGAGMSIPGISGGTLAIIMGMYERLLDSVTGIFKDPKKNIPFLLLFCLGGVCGLLTAAFLIGFVLGTPAAVPVRFAFLGAAAGCIPPIMREARFTPITPKKLLLLLLGVVLAGMISLIPEGLFSFNGTAEDYLMQALGGLTVAAALVLPGISASQMLYILGIYEPVLTAVRQLDLLSLLPLGIGLAVGIFITSAVISKLLKTTANTYIVILGFVIFSLRDMLPQWSSGTELVIGLICALIGFLLGYVISKKEDKIQHAEAKTS